MPEVETSVVTLVDGSWVDANNNSWNATNVTEDEAALMHALEKARKERNV